ncbi:N-acetyltransferase [Ascochyta rabiei]|uniref:N-acetyltransferase n=2 Tax=Didymella rabiei TaxID=5454 RepID=A0A162Z7S8_DIDRA|nr:N-acetyltransferase [Ascochyta rabiei]
MSPRREDKANPIDSLLCQQQEKLDNKNTIRRHNRRARKFVPLNLEDIKEKQKITTRECAEPVQRTEAPASSSRVTARGKVAAQNLSHQSKQSTPVRPTAHPRGHDSATKKSRKPRKRRLKGENSAKDKVTVMAAQLSGVYLPPHLRKRADVPVQPKTDVKLGDCIGIGSPPASVKSSPKRPVLNKVSSNPAITHESCLPSPPATVEEPSTLARGCNGWDNSPVEQPLTLPRRNENPRWPRPLKAPKEKHVWPKSRDIPRGLSSDGQSDGGIFFKSDSEGDPTYDVKKLIGWNGDWLPPPEEWAARKGFTDRHFAQVIERWANEHSRHCTKLMSIDSPAFSGVQDADGKWVTKDLVPRYWLHETIDNDSPRTFWEQLPHRAPTALSDVDITEGPPYWERWEDGHPDQYFMDALVVPEARIDVSDSANELEKTFAMLCANERLAKIQDIRASEARRREAKRNRPIPASIQLVSQLSNRLLNPKANIYLRPVQPADVRGIMAIYNHYVANTVHADELDELTEASIRGRIDDVVQANLPFLVAVAKRNKRKGPQGYVSETIVGYVQLDDYVNQSSMYRYTFELELYVHPGYVRQGIGKCLLDRIVYMANTGYKTRGGYEWVNEFEYLKNGKGRVVKTILASLHFERGDEIEWAAKYLGDFGFRKAGRFKHVGYKDGKVVDKVMFQLQTTEVIDPKSIPMVQG